MHRVASSVAQNFPPCRANIVVHRHVTGYAAAAIYQLHPRHAAKDVLTIRDIVAQRRVAILAGINGMALHGLQLPSIHWCFRCFRNSTESLDCVESTVVCIPASAFPRLWRQLILAHRRKLPRRRRQRGQPVVSTFGLWDERPLDCEDFGWQLIRICDPDRLPAPPCRFSRATVRDSSISPGASRIILIVLLVPGGGTPFIHTFLSPRRDAPTSTRNGFEMFGAFGFCHEGYVALQTVYCDIKLWRRRQHTYR